MYRLYLYCTATALIPYVSALQIELHVNDEMDTNAWNIDRLRGSCRVFRSDAVPSSRCPCDSKWIAYCCIGSTVAQRLVGSTRSGLKPYYAPVSTSSFAFSGSLVRVTGDTRHHYPRSGLFQDCRPYQPSFSILNEHEPC